MIFPFSELSIVSIRFLREVIEGMMGWGLDPVLLMTALMYKNGNPY